MKKFEKKNRNKLRRIPGRGSYKQKVVHEILDQGFVAHVGFSIDSQPYVIPMAYGRKGNTLYLHGAASSRLINSLKQGIPVCVTVTHLDGIVLARSAFHHSMNYRSVVVFGGAIVVTPEHKERALEIISEHILKDRWQVARKPNPKELKATTVLKINIEEASAKVRTGPPVDEKEDYNMSVWAGVIPVEQVYGTPIPDPQLDPGLLPGVEVRQIYQ